MSSRLVLCALALTACTNLPQGSIPDDGVPDEAPGCPSQMPQTAAACTVPNTACTYGGTTCECENPAWICRPAECPLSTAISSVFKMPCPMAELQCNYGFEDSYLCVGPEDQWVFCGNHECSTFALAVDGAPCCPIVFGACHGGPCGSCACGFDHHWSCDKSCLDGGATD